MYTMKLQQHVILFLLSVLLGFAALTHQYGFINETQCPVKGTDVILLKDYFSSHYLFQNDFYTFPSYTDKSCVQSFWIGKFIQDAIEGIPSSYVGEKVSLPPTIVRQYIDFYKKVRAKETITIIGAVTKRTLFNETLTIFGIRKNDFVPKHQTGNVCDELKQYSLSIASEGKTLRNILHSCVLYFVATVEIKGGYTFKGTYAVPSGDNIVPRKILEGYVYKRCASSD